MSVREEMLVEARGRIGSLEGALATLESVGEADVSMRVLRDVVTSGVDTIHEVTRSIAAHPDHDLTFFVTTRQLLHLLDMAGCGERLVDAIHARRLTERSV